MVYGLAIEVVDATALPTFLISAYVFFKIVARKSRGETAATDHNSFLASSVSLDIFLWKLLGRFLLIASRHGTFDPLPALEAEGSGILILDVGPMLLVVAFHGLRHLAPTALF